MSAIFVPSAPVLVDEVIGGVRLFEKISRIGHPRRCNPTNTSWIEVYRGVDEGRAVLFFCAREDLRGPTDDENIGRPGPGLDAARWRASGVPIVRLVDAGYDGVASVSGYPGVRLRALIDAGVHEGAALPFEVALDVAMRSLVIVDTMRAAGLTPGDTFIGWDGGISLLPAAEVCRRHEQPSWNGDEVFDALVVDSPGTLRDILTGEDPPPLFGLVPEAHPPHPLPPGTPAAIERLCRCAPASYGVGSPASSTSSRPRSPRWWGRSRSACSRPSTRDRRRSRRSFALASPRRTRVVPVYGDDDRIAFYVERHPVSAAQLAAFRERSRGSGTTSRALSSSAGRAPAVVVGHAEAAAYAASIGRRLPTEAEWRRAAKGADARTPSVWGADGYCRVWEWTATPENSGFVVRGGRFRNRGAPAADTGTRSWEAHPARDVGFRCVVDENDD